MAALSAVVAAGIDVVESAAGAAARRRLRRPLLRLGVVVLEFSAAVVEEFVF
jgi:hypothetical protein